MSTGAEELPAPTGSAEALGQLRGMLESIEASARSTALVQVGARTDERLWQGAASDAYRGEVQEIRIRVIDALSHLDPIRAAIQRYESELEEHAATVAGLQEHFDEIERDYHRRLRALHAPPSLPADEIQLLSSRYDGERIVEQSLLRVRHRAIVWELRAHAHQVAGEIQAILEHVVPAEQRADPTSSAAHLYRGLPISGGEILAAHAAEQAPVFIDALDAALNGGDEDALHQVIQDYAHLASDPYFGHEVLDRMGIEGIDDAWRRLYLPHLYRAPESLALRQEAMTVLGSLYVSAAGSSKDGLVPRSHDYARITQWREETLFPSLIEHGHARLSATAGMGDVSGEAHEYSGYWLQGQLLAAASLHGYGTDAAYASEVGADMIRWDRDLRRSATPGQIAPPNAQDDLDYLVPPPGGLRTGYPGMVWNDPLYTMLHSASHDQDASITLLLSEMDAHDADTTESSLPTTSAMRYLVAERGGTTTELTPFADRGQLLGEIVESYGSDRHDARQTELAAEYLNSLTRVVGFDYANGMPVPSHAFEEARGHTARVLAAHMESVYYHRDHRYPASGILYEDIPAGSPSYREGVDTFRVLFTTDDPLPLAADESGDDAAPHRRPDDGLSAVLRDLALDRPDDLAVRGSGDHENPPALQEYVAAAWAHGEVALANSLHQYAHHAALDDQREMSYWLGIAERSAIETRIKVLDDAISAYEHNELLQEEQQQRFLSLMGGLGNGALALLPPPAAAHPGGLIAWGTARTLGPMVIDTMASTAPVATDNADLARAAVMAVSDRSLGRALYENVAWAVEGQTPDDDSGASGVQLRTADGTPLEYHEMMTESGRDADNARNELRRFVTEGRTITADAWNELRLSSDSAQFDDIVREPFSIIVE